MKSSDIYIFIPLIVAIITSIVAPIILSRRQKTSDFSTSIIEEGREMRQELRERIDALEQRLEVAQEKMNKTLDEIRALRSENERSAAVIREMKAELSRAQRLLGDRVTALEKTEADNG